MTVTDERWLGKMALQRLVGQMAGIQDDLSEGACVNRDPELWFPSSGDPHVAQFQLRAAKKICRACPVRDACLLGALQRKEPHGIWGGYTSDERRAMKAGR